MHDPSELEGFARAADRASRALARSIDGVCVALMVVLVLDVWLGVFARYVWPLPITFMEEAARYLMIWVALLAVSAGISRREHIGVQMLFAHLPPTVRRCLLAFIDVLGIVFFAALFWYGLGMVERGGRVTTMIYGMSKSLPFAAVPTSAALAMLQLSLVAVRDQLRLARNPDVVVCP
jgi:TRAP-type C4-dicarboxylate transport system permease small subunit